MPNVPRLVPEVSVSMLTPEQLDPRNVNNSRPIRPEDEPVIAAYVQAAQAINFAASQSPVNPDAPELLGAPLTGRVLSLEQAGLGRFAAAGHRMDVNQGVTHRPYVLGPVESTGTTVYDCELAGHYWVDSTGARIDEANWPAGPGRIVEVGLAVKMVEEDGRWLWSDSFVTDVACAG